LPLQRHLGGLIAGRLLSISTVPALDYQARDLFAPDAIDPNAFTPGGSGNARANGQVIELGRRLFNEKALSGDGLHSCAGCHRPDHWFAESLPRSAAIDGHSFVRRNAPSLYYTAYQYAQFWDGRAPSLEEQVRDVMRNPAEMNARPGMITDERVEAIAAYVGSLAPFRSAFDRYLAGDRKALGREEIAGFNLFMGKARCGTCHFIPLFNGLRPPLYDITEFEVPGTPATADLDHPVADTDMGRLDVFPIPFNRQAFKTPTLRNVAMTAPYMHNGSLPTLEKVMDFYNRGGGAGIGLVTDDQTLSADSLRLSPREIGQIISFLQALTDERDKPPGANARPPAKRHSF
jgi:cytochrome c peroxidase